jgi:hypothetical protein
MLTSPPWPSTLGRRSSALASAAFSRRHWRRRVQQGRGAAVVLVEQGQQQVLRLDELLVVADGQALGVGDGLLELGGEFVEAHGIVWPFSILAGTGALCAGYFRPFWLW